MCLSIGKGCTLPLAASAVCGSRLLVPHHRLVCYGPIRLRRRGNGGILGGTCSRGDPARSSSGSAHTQQVRLRMGHGPVPLLTGHPGVSREPDGHPRTPSTSSVRCAEASSGRRVSEPTRSRGFGATTQVSPAWLRVQAGLPCAVKGFTVKRAPPAEASVDDPRRPVNRNGAPRRQPGSPSVTHRPSYPLAYVERNAPPCSLAYLISHCS